MPFTAKTGSFKNPKSYSSSIYLKTNNMFEVFNHQESIEKTEQSSLPPFNEIIWGKGFKSMVGVSWADDCGA